MCYFILSLQVKKAHFHYENLSLSLACETVLEIGNAGNLFMDEHAPWSLFKQGGSSSETAKKVLYESNVISILLKFDVQQ